MNRLRRVVTIASVAVFLLFMSSWLWIKGVEWSRWNRVRERVSELRREADLRCGPRPVLRGEALPGDAWDDYLPALDRVAGMGNGTPIWRIILGGTPEQRSAGEAMLASYGEAVDLMQRGTRRAAAKRMRLHEHEVPEVFTPGTPLSRAVSVGVLAVARSRLLSEQGRHREAVELLLDVCRFGEDVGRDGSSSALAFGYAILRPAVIEMGEQLAQGVWTADERSRLARELGEIDASLPPSEVAILGELEWLGELILSDRLFSHWFREKPFPPEYLPRWRHAYSMRLLMTSGFDVVDGAVKRIRHADTGPWFDEVKRWTEFNEELKASKNITAGLYGANYSNRTRRELLSQFRLLRMGVHHAATGEILAQDDPFGTKLLHRLDAAKLTLWSVGKDGIDDQGAGSWNQPGGKDIVLTVRRAGR